MPKIAGILAITGVAWGEVYQEETNYLDVPEAARPLDGLLPPKGLEGRGSLLEINSQYLKRDHRVNFDTRQVEIVSYVQVPAPAGGGTALAPAAPGDSLPRWSTYYSEIDAYSQDMQGLALRRGWLTSLIGHDEGVEGGNPGTFIFDLPFRVPDWMKRVGVDKPKLTINGSYKLVVEGSRESGSGALYGGKNWFPQLHMDQQPQFSVRGSIGRLISIEINSEEGFGTNLKEQLKISYKGEGDELEDDIIQEVEAGNTSLALTGTSLTGYTENHKGLFGLKMRLKFGPVEATVIASQEGGAQEKQTLGSSSELKTFAIEDKAMELHKHFFLNLADRKAYADSSNWLIPNNPKYIQVRPARKPIVVYQLLYGNEESGYRDTAEACAYDIAGIRQTDVCEFGRWKPLVNGVDFTYDENLRMLNIPSGSVDQTYGVKWDRDFLNPNGTGIPDKRKLILIHSKNKQRLPILDSLIWRNVYYIGNVDKKDRDLFKLEVVDQEGRQRGLGEKDTITYARQLGLEKPDQPGKVDYDNALIFNFDEHYMVLPCISRGIAGGDPGNCLTPMKRVNPQTEIYSQYLDEILNGPTTTKFMVLSRERRSSFDVRENSQTVNGQQCFDITPGTESVLLNGSIKLTKDLDYEVLYETGQITLKSARARDPNAEVTVAYECTPAFQIQDKILLGTRIEWKLDEISDQSLMGATLLYKSQSTTADRPELGREPFNQFLWGFNTRLTGEPKWMTKLVNQVPLVKSEAVSKTNFEFEIAQSRYNPNTKNSAYLENFESSQNALTMPVTYYSWFKGSPPELNNQGLNDVLLDYRHQGNLIWHSSSAEQYGNIYGNTGNSFTNSRNQTLLSLLFSPNDNLTGKSWGGIMRGFSSGLNNQSKKRTLEVVVLGKNGVLNVDLGEISEDISIPTLNQAKPDGILQSEVDVRKGELTNESDPGIDGIKGESEAFYWECKPECYVTRKDGSSNLDPAGDDYNEPKTGETDVSAAVNGTEGNDVKKGGYSFDTEDLDRSGSLEKRNRFLRFRMALDSTCNASNYCENLQRGWRRYQIPLYGGGSKIDPGNTLSESAILSNVRIMRVWLGEVAPRVGRIDVQLARLALVGNTWEESDRNLDYEVDAERFTSGDLVAIGDTASVKVPAEVSDNNRLKIEVINKQETPSYQQSPNTPREKNTNTDEPLPERSLVMRYENLHPGETVYATRLLGSEPKDLTLYERLQMEIHPDVRYAVGSPVQVSGQNRISVGLRMGKDLGNRDSKDYYEIRLPMSQTAVYDPNHIDLWLKNSFDLKVSDLTRLKNDSLYRRNPGQYVEKKLYHPERGDSSLVISVLGNPTMARIDWMRLVIYVDSGAGERQSGDVWVNDLRLEGVDKSTGTAMRTRVQFDFADFLTVSGDLNYTNGNFTSMSQTKATPANAVSKVDFNTALSLYAGKFFPDAWGVNIPISLTYRGSMDRPFVMPSSDLQLSGTDFKDIAGDFFDGRISSLHHPGDSIRDIESAYARVYQTTNFEKTFSISYKKDRRSNAWINQALFERPEIEYKFRGNEHIAYYDENYGRNYTTRLRYDLSPFTNKSYKPFSFADSSKWVPKAITGFEVTPLPDKFSLTIGDLNFNRTLEVNKPRTQYDIILRDSAEYQVDLSHGLDMEWRLFPSMSFGYRLDVSRDFDRERECFDESFFSGGDGRGCAGGGFFARNLIWDWDSQDRFSQGAPLSDTTHRGDEFFILNREKNRNQTFHYDFNPNLVQWLTTGMSFNSGYRHTWYESSDNGQALLGLSQPSHFESSSDHNVKFNTGLNLPNLMTSIGSLGGKGFESLMESIKRKMDDYRLRTFDFTYNVSHKYNNDAYTYGELARRYPFAGLFYADQLGWRYGLDNWRTLFEGEPDPYRSDWLQAPDPNLNLVEFNHQVDRNIDVGSGFTIPVANLDIYGNLKWTKSYILYRGVTPSDTSIIWPEYTVTASLGDFASKLPWIRTNFRSMTASSSYNYKHEERHGLFSPQAESDLQSYKFAPLLRLSGTTNKDIRIENSINFSQDFETRYSKVDDTLRFYRSYLNRNGISREDSLQAYQRSPNPQPIRRLNVGDDLSVSYDVETQKGLQFWRYYIKLKNNLRLKLTNGVIYTLVEEKQPDGGNPRTTDQIQVTLKPEASYNFTNNVDALFYTQYIFKKDFKTDKEETIHNVTVHGEFTMRF